MNSFSHIFQEGKIGNLTVKNRIVMPPMGTNLASDTGGVTDQMISYYAERAKGGVGLIIVEIAAIDYPVGKAILTQLRVDADRFIPGLSELADAAHRYGAKIFIQIHHAGRQTDLSSTEGRQPVAPSAVACKVVQECPKELTEKEIKELVEKFATAALRVKRAGVDGIELHGAHGYLIGQFMSPYTNKRTDQYGGSLKNRMRFPLEIIKRVRELTGDFPISFRFSADEFVDGGIKIDEAKEIAKILEQAGVDVLSVSSGNYESMTTVVEPMYYEEGWRVHLAEAIKQVVSIPVISVGVIRKPITAEQILKQGKADFIATGRGNLADPDWVHKAYQGKSEEIRRCITCNSCIRELFAGRHIRCAVNASAGREKDYSLLKKAEQPKYVMVIGGGPAGMEAARVAAQRGHRVTLIEQGPRLGGQLNLACVPPGKGKIKWLIEYLDGQLNRARVETRLNTKANPELILQSEPDTLIIATGGNPLFPDIPGIDGPNVLNAWRVLDDKDLNLRGRKVVIAGGGLIGCETAHYLNEQGAQVTIVEMLPELAVGMESIHRLYLLQELKNSGVEALTNYRIIEIKNQGLICIDPHGNHREVQGDFVILSLGTAPANSLITELQGKVPELYTIGDCVRPGRIIDAIYDGSRIGRLI